MIASLIEILFHQWNKIKKKKYSNIINIAGEKIFILLANMNEQLTILNKNRILE